MAVCHSTRIYLERGRILKVRLKLVVPLDGHIGADFLL